MDNSEIEAKRKALILDIRGLEQTIDLLKAQRKLKISQRERLKAQLKPEPLHSSGSTRPDIYNN